MPYRFRAWICIAGGLLGVTCVARAASRNDPLTTAELLVDLARDYGLSQHQQQTAADVQHVRCLLQAAVRLDPKLADAYVWLYELARLGGDPAEAGRALNGLLEADPTNQTAFALWLAAGTRAQQTIEKRAEWLRAAAAGRRPPPLLAMVHIELARLALERMDPVAARAEAAQALELEPASVEAATLALQTLDEQASAAERLQAMLRALRATPLALEAAWRVGLLLDEYGFADEAGRFYEYARELRAPGDARPAGAGGTRAPGGFLLDLARNGLARGQLDAAIECTRQAIAAEPVGAAEAGMFLHYLLRRRGLTSEAEDVRRQLAKRFTPLTDPNDWPVNEVAQAAWFYCTIDKQPHLALPRAEAAYARAPGDVFVQRVLGWAQALNLKTEAAQRTLEPIASRDAYAAYLLATLLREAGDEAGARRVMQNLDPAPTAGPAFDLLSELTQPATTQPATQPDTKPATQPATSAATQPAGQRERERHPGIAKVLTEFDDEVLKFHQAPGKYLEARAALEDVGPGPGDPWWAVFSLTNRGPFPITLGPDAMVNPVFLLSFTVEGDQQRTYPALTTVSVDQARVLYPGQTVRVRRTIDVGPLRRVSRQTPQQLQRLTLQVLLDAELGGDGQWRPSVGGQALRPVYFNRVPAGTGQEALAALFSALAGDSDVARVRAIEVLAELLGERQRADLKKLSYEPAPVPAERLRAALLSLLGSESWELRVRTLEALQVVGLDQPMVAAVERCMEHPHWLVRLMALRVLARQGRTFSGRAATIARNDTDELVRALAESYLAKWTEATSRPSTQAPK